MKLAAQPLVRLSYRNVCNRYLKLVKAIVNITSDKAKSGYGDIEKMGGYDPYSSSKGCADLLVNSYFNIKNHITHL